MKSLFNALYYTFVTAVLIIGLFLLATLVPIPGNFKAKIVKSGSMEPAIKTGSVVVIKPTGDYKLGDVITFGPDTKTQVPTTHRIVEVRGEGTNQVFSTKGDANNAPDPQFVRFGEVDGKVLLTLPYMGYLLDFARKPIGFFLLVGVPAIAVIIDEFRKILSEVSKMRAKKNYAAKDITTEDGH